MLGGASPVAKREWAPRRIFDSAQAKSYTVKGNHTTVANSVVSTAGVLAGRFTNPDGSPAAGAAVNVTGRSRSPGIKGTLTDAAGAPAGGVYFQVLDADSTAPVLESMTKADGTFDFENWIRPGHYKVEFTAEGGTQWAHQKASWDTADVYTAVSGQTLVVDDQLTWVPAAD